MSTAGHLDDGGVWDGEVVPTSGADVVQLHKTPPVHAPTAPAAPSKARAAVAHLTDRPYPNRRQLTDTTRWWTLRLAKVIPWLPWLLVKELVPVCRGIARVCTAWAAWVSCVELAAAAKSAEGNQRAKATADVEDRRTGRRRLSLAAAALAGAGGGWLWLTHLHAAAAATILCVGVLDLIGRRGRETEPFLPPAALPSVLSGNVPLSQITESILAAFDREGFEDGSVRVARPLAWDPARREYRISLSVRDAIRPEHVRAVERAIGARDHAIRNLATDTSTVRQLVIRVGDPLAHVDPPPFIPTGTVSIADPLDLGESAGDLPFALRFAGVHAAVVGRTGSGKSKGLLWTVIDRLSACRDVVLWGVDLQAGPALPMWRGVIQRTAYDEDTAEQLLHAALAEINRRMRVLQMLAESDDDDDDADEWHPGLGPALEIVLDEFAVLSDYDGKKKSPDLMGPVERIVRTGRKVWVGLVLATQKTGNSDFGSTVISSQVAIKMLMSCEESDTVRMLSTEKRDGGWSPHLLAPAVEGAARDAGKLYLSSPSHDLPDEYRTYAPMSSAEVKRRARQRITDGLPTLDGRRADAVDAVEVPPVLAAVEAAFRDVGDPDRMATADLLGWLRDAGHVFDADAKTAGAQLAEQLRPDELRPEARWRPTPGANSIRGYWLADVRAAIRRKT